MSDKTAITLYVDADACPVKDEVLTVSYRHNLKVYLVSNQWMRLEVGPLVEKIVVPEGADAADDWIADHIGPHGIAITADIPLAKRCLDKDAAVLGPTGRPFSENNIGNALALREIKAHQRETGESKGYNASFSKADRSRFLQALESEIQKILNA
ncbi:YaiI/YqxD family protein [Paremcibacter congregatus]|uniref:YaiI/YqxD family protein n=1 Tax=Paremcibacter congregatus TaxID=2043170 RepID=UPI0030EBB650|tara:strand:+ start:899 stop:1363 length:465 start_codon:yes stop_codon:yes gene_type:complete